MNYNEYLTKTIKANETKAKKFIVFAIIFLALALSIFVASCFFISDSTIIYLSIANTVLIFMTLSFVYYAFFGVVIPIKKENIIYTKILKDKETSIKGEVLEIKKHITIDQGIVIDEIVVSIDKQEIVLSLLEAFGVELIEHNTYVFTTRSNYLLGASNEK